MQVKLPFYSIIFHCQNPGSSVYVNGMGINQPHFRPTGRIWLFSAIALFLLLYPTCLIAQDESEPLILEHADKLESSGGNGDIVNLIGHVHFIHDNANLYSQRATWYRASGLVQFIDSVLVQEQGRQITAQTMTYYRRDRRVTAVHDVAVIDRIQNIELHCERADYLRDTKQLEATGSPKLVLNPADDSARMEITANRLTYFGINAHGTAYDSVVITRHDLIAHAGQAEFFKEPERAILYQNPIITNDQNQLAGDTISIFTENRKLNRVLVQGHAKATYKTLPDTLISEYTTAELDGRQLEAFFKNDKIEMMITRYNATSLYKPALTDTLVRGTNLASGDSISLYFAHATIKRVFISGGAQGKFLELKLDDEGKVYFDTTNYSADEIDYSFDKSEIDLNRNGQMTYKDMALNAGQIRYDTKSRILIAEGIPGDTSGKPIQPPALKQGSEELFGDRMSYNIDTKKGQVRMARTKYDGGFYSGKALRQASRDVLFVSQANYTSCDKEEDPHYHFHSDKMKMINRDKVVARPVILFIGELPVFALPYYVFPIRKGRHSGFLPFELGNFQGGNRFIRNLGYYWAASDYYDLTGSLDFYENSRTIINGRLQYALMYKLTGNVSINYAKESTWDLNNFKQLPSNRWQVNFSHNQTISPTANLTGSGTFVSDKNYISQNVYNPGERLNRTVSADMSFAKSWPKQSVSLVVQARQDWNLDTDERTELLPSFSIGRSRLPLFAAPSKTKKKIRIRPDEQIEEPKTRFYHSIYFDIRSTGQNLRQRIRNSVDSTFFRKDYQTLITTSSLSSPQKFLGFLTLSPSANVTNSLLRLEPGRIADSLGLTTESIKSRTLYSLSIGANTSIYGTVYPNRFRILGIRHVMTPAISYSFTPSIKTNQGYFRYIGGGSGSSRSKSLGYSLNNLFQGKFQAGDVEKKVDLFTLGFSGSYNFAAESLQFSPLSTSLRTTAIPNVDLSVNAVHSFYNFVTPHPSEVQAGVPDDYQTPSGNLIAAHRRSLLKPRLTSLTISSGVRTGYHPSGGKKDNEESDKKQPDLFEKRLSPTEQGNLGIDLALAYSYSESRGAGKPVKSQWLNVSTEIQPTLKWRMEYECRYNVISKRIESQSLNIGRDLHCWQMSFNWIPSGAVAGYYFRISIKTLPDIKIESSRGGLRGPYNY
ncbi:MAG TPA: hypothetical protein DCZ43_13265 [candidate division Zixibacteria bacterium]|nr:hypothetical protein [candidate division Zixibacteria bacterium]